MLRRRSVRFMGVALPGVAAASCAPESALPLSAAGLCKPLPPPEFFDEAGRKLPARLIQVQTVFRHGARLPVEDSGCRDGLCTWTPADSDKRHQLSRFGQIRLYAHGDGDALSPVEVFGGGSGGLVGGGSGGRLTPLGLQQAVELGNELRARYVDASAQTCASISPARLLPATWERARRLVVPRSTRVERTVYTAAGVLHGLYPAVDGHRQIPEIEISLSGEPSDEFLVLNDAACPRLQVLFRQGLRLSAANLDEQQRRCIDTVEQGAGWLVDDPQWKLSVWWGREPDACGGGGGPARVLPCLACSLLLFTHPSMMIPVIVSRLHSQLPRLVLDAPRGRQAHPARGGGDCVRARCGLRQADAQDL